MEFKFGVHKLTMRLIVSGETVSMSDFRDCQTEFTKETETVFIQSALELTNSGFRLTLEYFTNLMEVFVQIRHETRRKESPF